MAINPLGGVGPSGVAGAGGVPKAGADSFGKALQGQKGPAASAETPTLSGPAPQATRAVAAPSAKAGPARAGGAPAVEGTAAPERATAHMLDQVSAAQKRMDHILQLAESGKTFSPAELLALQAHVYRASQELDLAGKVVEKATGGVKQVLQTQV